MQGKILVKKENNLTWIPHPIAKNVERKILLSKETDEINIACMLVRGAKGSEVPEHIHEDADDIIYSLRGKFKMWVDGIGEFDVKKGVIIRVPKGVKHKLYDVQEEFLIFDIFVPATV